MNKVTEKKKRMTEEIREQHLSNETTTISLNSSYGYLFSSCINFTIEAGNCLLFLNPSFLFFSNIFPHAKNNKLL